MSDQATSVAVINFNPEYDVIDVCDICPDNASDTPLEGFDQCENCPLNEPISLDDYLE